MHAELKHLETRAAALRAELEVKRQEVSAASHDMTRIQGRLAKVEEQIENLKATEQKVIITEHALLRYLERVRGIDMEAVKTEMLPQRVADAIKSLGSGTYPVAHASTYKLAVKGGAVVTVITKDEAD